MHLFVLFHLILFIFSTNLKSYDIIETCQACVRHFKWCGRFAADHAWWSYVHDDWYQYWTFSGVSRWTTVCESISQGLNWVIIVHFLQYSIIIFLSQQRNKVYFAYLDSVSTTRITCVLYWQFQKDWFGSHVRVLLIFVTNTIRNLSIQTLLKIWIGRMKQN